MGTKLPLPKNGDRAPQFSTHVYCGQTAGWIKMPLGMDVGLRPGRIVLDRDPAPPKKSGTAFPNFRPMSVVVKRLDGSGIQDATRYEGMPRPMPRCVRCETSSSAKRGTPSNFRPMSFVAKRSPISATAEHLLYSASSSKRLMCN